MPDFDINLNPILVNSNKQLPSLPNPSSTTPDAYPDLSGSRTSGAEDPLFAIFGKGPKVDKMLPTATAQQLYENRKYSTFDPNVVDVEDQKAYAQSNWDKAANGVLKGLNLAGTTVAGGFGMLYGTSKWAFGGKFSDIWDNKVMQGLDKWNNEVDQNYLPNYYTNVEKNANWYSTDNWLKANFLYDKLIKNSGFAVGAMVSGNIVNAGLKGAGAAIGALAAEGSALAESSQAFKILTPILRNTARAFSQGKNIEAAQILEKELSSIVDVEKASSELAKIAKTTNQFSTFGDTAKRTLIAGYSSAGESGFEALNTGNEFKRNLIEKYKESHDGQEPSGEELKTINDLTASVGKTSFFANLAILSLTEYAQLPKLLGSSYSAEKQAANSLLGTTEDVLLKDGKYIAKESTKVGRILDKSLTIGNYFFDPKEGAQEGIQQIIQVGTQNYYNKAYKGQKASAWVDGFLYGLNGENEKGEGVGAINSKEGWESILLGGITGGPMQARSNYIQNKVKSSNTTEFLNLLNTTPSFKEAFKERLDSVNRATVLQEQQQQATIAGNKLEAKDLNTDMMHNYLSTRIKYGRYDMITADLQELKQTASTEAGLASLKEEGIANINDTVQSYQARVNNLETYSKNLNELTKYVNLTYGGETIKNSEGQTVKKYNSAHLDKMIYAASKIADYDVRIPQVSEVLLGKGIDVQSIVDDELTNDSPTRLQKELNKINELEDINKDTLKQNLQDVIELSKRRKQFFNEYEDIKKNPNKYSETGEKESTNKEGKKFRTTPSDSTKEKGPNWAVQSRDRFKGDRRTYADLVKQYGEGEQNKYQVLKKITESPHATTMEKELASHFLKYTNKDSKIILGDRQLPNPGVSGTDFSSKDASVSRINYEYNSEDYEGVPVPVEYIMLHEIGHDLTVYGLSDTSDSFYDELTPLFNFIQEHFKKDENKYAKNGLIKNGEFYAFKNIKEFATEALSNRDFQRYLDTIPYKNTQKTVWESFLENLKTFFRRLFGSEDETLLNETVAIITNNIDRIYKNNKERNKKLNLQEQQLKEQQEQLDKQQKEIEKKSGTVATGNPETETIEPEGAKKTAEKFFKSSITESEDWNNPNDSAPHIKNAREFLLNAKNFSNRENLRAILVTPNSENKLGLTGLTALSYGTNDSSKSTDVEEGFVAQVFVEQDGSKLFFVDKEGKRIGEVGSPIDVNSVIFQTMPTTSVTTSKGKSRARTGEEDKLDLEAKRWKAQRELLFAQDGSKSQAYEFIISRGVPVTSDVENFHVAESLGIPVKLISKTQDLVLISTTGFITHNGQNIQFPKGRPVLQYGDVLEPLQNTKITPSESQTIFQCILNISNNILDATKTGKKFNIQGMKETAFLQNILFWGKGQKSANQIYIDGTNLHVGKTSFPLTEIADKQSEIVEAVTGLYRNINNESLKDISVKFREQRFDGKELVEVEWKSYQEYLLSSKNPDGSSRNTTSTPLVTNIVAPTDLSPINFKQKYATLEQIEYPQVATPAKQEAKTEVPTTNTISIMGQNVPFTYTEEDGNFTVEIQSSEATKALAENDELVNKYTSTLKSINLPVADNPEQIIIDFLSLQKAAQLKKAALEKAKEVVTPVTPIAPVSTNAKADIERRRQEELNNLNSNSDDIRSDLFELTLSTPISGGYTIGVALKADTNTGYLYSNTLSENFDKIEDAKEYREQIKEEVLKPKINAKYDAELAALESQVNGAENLTNEEDKTAPLDAKKIKPRDADYMRVGGEEVLAASPEQFEEFKKWHAENVPNIPFEVLENLVDTFDGEKAFGVFENGVAKFYKGAPGTTAYHEAFEGVWKHFLTLDEKNAIIQELRDSVKDFKDRATGKTLNYATATDEQIKERIADDFAEFKSGKIPAKSLIGKIVEFFRNIMNFFKSFVQKPTLKESLFKEIEKGRFKESKIASPDVTPEYSRVPGLTETQVYELTQDMTALSSFYLFGVDSKKSLYDVAKVTSKELFDWIKGEYIKQDLYEQLGDARWNQLVNYTKENLKTIGVSFKRNEDNIDEETIDINTEGANKNDYDGNPFKQDWKKNSPYAVKLSLLVPKTVYTNQENKTELEIPERQTTSYQGYKLANFNKLFVSLMDKLANTTNVNKFIDKFFNLAKKESDLVVPFKRLGANLDGSINFSKFKKDDWRLFVDYMRVFTKQRPDAVIQYTNEGSTYIAPANQFTASKNIESQWFEEMKALSSKEGSAIKKDKEKKTYTIDLKDIKLPKTIEQTLDFLNDIGVNFPMDVYNRLNKKEQTAVLKAGGSIYTYIQSNPTVATLDGKILGINGPLNTLSNIIVKTTNPNIDSTHFNVEGERVGSYTENNYPSEFENIFNETSTLDELLEAMPQLKDVYAQGSQILKKGGLFFDEDGNRIATIKVGTTGGSKNLNDDKGTSIAKLTLGNRFIQEINNNLQGNYYVLIPADGSTEWMLNLGNSISFKDVQEGRGNSEIVSIFKEYLNSEIELALQDGRSKISNVGSKAKELRFFKEILLEKDVIAIQGLLAENDAQGIQDYLKENKESIKSAIKQYFENSVQELKSNLQNNQQILGIDGNYSIPNILSEFLSSNKINNGEISEQTLNDILFYLQANYAIANMEMHKILFGDPYQFKIKNNQLDETKRIKSFLSPRRRTFDSVPFNNFLNTEYNKAQDIELDENEFGYHTHKAYTNTSTLSDVELVGSVALMEDMPKEIRDAYSKTNEADAASFILDNTYREVKLKNEQWPDEAEEWHQWHLAYARQNMPGYVYVNQLLAKQDAAIVSKPEPKFIADILKPIVSGVKYNQSFANLVLDKFSQMPLYYKWVQGTNLEKLYLQMHKENKGYVVMVSGRKVGSEGEHSIYNPNGAYNESSFNNNIQVPWTAYGIQVENAYEKPKDQTRGSQSVKLVSVDLFEGGKPIGATPERQAVIQKAYDRNNDVLDEMHNNAYINLLSKIGVEDMGDSFKLTNPAVVSETLANELLRREMNRNDKETIQLDENGEFIIPFEASPAYYKIKSILYSLVNKALISPKLNGAPHVQAPVTLQESGNRKLAIKTETGYKKITQKEYDALSEEQKKKVVLTDDTLKFYTRAEPWCEVMLPHWFREKLGKHSNKTDEELIKYLNNHPDGKKILMGIGFRIPTQSVSSMEVFKVKGFLPKSMGYTVIVPSEITTKAGSDFDIDKLNMYLKSIYIDQNGDIQLVKYINNEAETKAFYSKVYENTIQKDIDKLTSFDDFRNKMIDVFTSIESLEAVTLNNIKNILSEDNYNFYNTHLNTLQEIINQAAEENLNPSQYIKNQIEKLGSIKENLTSKLLNESLKQDFVNNMYKKALENEYYDSMQELLSLPETFDRLLSPVSDGGLKDMAATISELRGDTENNIKTRMLNRTYLTKLRHAFVTGKRWVGIAAVNITSHSIFQKSDVYVDPSKFSEVPKRDQAILGDGSIILPHNKNSKGLPSLSGVKTVKGDQTISDRLSGYATAFVDIAKDPYIMKLVKSNSIVGTFMFLERLGCGEMGVKFLNQPIISEYLDYLDATDQKGLFNKANIDYIKNIFSTTEDVLHHKQVEINLSQLDENIKKYSTYKIGFHGEGGPSDFENAVQHKIFDEFLKYAKMAEYNYKITQAMNYDTTRFGSGDALTRKQIKTRQAKNNIISDVTEIINNSFLKTQSELLDKSMNSMGAILKLEERSLRDITDEILIPYAERDFMPDDDFDRISNKIKLSFLDYLVQTKSGINDDINSLLLEASGNIQEQLAQAKKAHPEMQILKDLQIESSKRIGGAKTIKLAVNTKEAFEEDNYISMMEELKNIEPELYNSIVKISILQGAAQTAVSIKNIIPLADYAKIVSPIINTLSNTEDVKAFSKGAFQRSNWTDDSIVPTIDSLYFKPEIGTDKEPIVREIVNKQGEIIDEYTNYFSPAFIPGKNLGFTGKQLLALDEFNALSKGDFIKIPRIVNVRGTTENVDILTNRSVSNFALRKKAAMGDFSFKDYYGYQLVRDATGEPVTKIETDYKGEQFTKYIYKQINLYGDGKYTAEYRMDTKPSAINNGTVKIEQELSDSMLIQEYGGNLVEQENVVPLSSQQPTQAVSKKKELFTTEKGISQKSFRNKPLVFVEKIETTKDKPVAMRNATKQIKSVLDNKLNKSQADEYLKPVGITYEDAVNNPNGLILIDKKEFLNKYNEKAWTVSATQRDGSKSTPLSENQFNSLEEFFTFALIHEIKHDTIKKQDSETIGQYEDRINQAALEDLKENYDTSNKSLFIVNDKVKDLKTGLTGYITGSFADGFVNVVFKGGKEEEVSEKDLQKITDEEYAQINVHNDYKNINDKIGQIVEVFGNKYRLLSVNNSGYAENKELLLQSKSGLTLPVLLDIQGEYSVLKFKDTITIGGQLIAELGITEEEWNNLTEEEKNKIKSCN